MAESLSFTAQVDEWATAEKERMRKIALESTQRLVSVISNAVPVDTGFCRASVRASLTSMPQIDPNSKGEKGATYLTDLSEISAEISNLQLGQTIYVGWTAVYANALEYGHSQQAPQGFVRIGCAQWPAIVKEVVNEAKLIAGP